MMFESQPFPEGSSAELIAEIAREWCHVGYHVVVVNNILI